MTTYLIRRLLQAILVLFLVSVLTFIIIHAAPGGPLTILLRPGQSPEALKVQAHLLGLDQPLPIQYIQWLWRLVHGNFGNTYNGNLPIGTLMWPRLWHTVLLMGTVLIVTWIIAIPWGIYNGTHEYGISDTVASVVAYIGYGLPVFWLGLMFQVLFGLRLGWLPIAGMWDQGQNGNIGNLIIHMILPVSVLVITSLASWLKYSRSSMLEVFGQDYIRTARAKGVAESKVIFRHALRNALIPIITLMGLNLPTVVVGAALTESVFNWPGMGQFFVQMAYSHEYNALLATAIVTAFMVVIGNLLADILYSVVDPRVRLGAKGAALA